MTTTTSWKSGVSSFFDTASDWTNGVPVAGDTALITARGTYTVNSSQNNSVGVLEMAKGATLAISPNTMFDVTSSTGSGALAGTIKATNATLELGTSGTSSTFNNTGIIDLTTVSLVTNGTVTLTGKGKIDGSGGTNELFGTSGSTLINDGNTIEGQITLGDSSFDFVNEARGVIDANSSGNIFFIEAADCTNSGLIEATAGPVEFVGSDVTQTSTGKIKGTSFDGEIGLVDSTITGGSISIGKGSGLAADSGDDEIDTTKPIANAGDIASGDGNLTIVGAVKNTSTGDLSTNPGTDITVDGAVTGGSAELFASGGISFNGPSSAKVIFETNATATLFLGDATKFTGTVAGMSGNPNASIDLANMPYADGPKLDFDAAKHLLTVTDPKTGTVDKIKIADGASTFAAEPSAFATTLIFDPPPQTASAPQAGVPLLTQAVASFAAAAGTGGVTAHREGRESNVAPDALAANPHWHA